MYIEMGAMLSLAAANRVLEALKSDKGTLFAFMESGRSNDLFEDKQFGEYGEAGFLTIIVDKQLQTETFENIYEAANLTNDNVGLIFLGRQILQVSEIEGSLRST